MAAGVETCYLLYLSNFSLYAEIPNILIETLLLTMLTVETLKAQGELMFSCT